jgi:riboflavin kinase/FMN adenylyltransferase
MKVFTDIEPASSSKAIVLCIGFFDGVHLGHQAVIREARTLADTHQALCCVLTFANHPATILRPESAPKLLSSNTMKQSYIAELGVDKLFMPAFTKVLSEQTPEQFIDTIRASLPRLMGICIGHDWRFGKNASGDADTLTTLAAGHGIAVTVVDAVNDHEGPISSTRIRKAVQAGNLEEAERLLGRPWQFSGRVVQGDQVGNTLGFPTANIETQPDCLLPPGVFAASAVVAGSIYPAVLNIGNRPTVHKDSPVKAEAHLLDFDGSLYGEEMIVIPHNKLREETRFDSTEALKMQIKRDIRAATKIMNISISPPASQD